MNNLVHQSQKYVHQQFYEAKYQYRRSQNVKNIQNNIPVQGLQCHQSNQSILAYQDAKLDLIQKASIGHPSLKECPLSHQESRHTSVRQSWVPRSHRRGPQHPHMAEKGSSPTTESHHAAYFPPPTYICSSVLRVSSLTPRLCQGIGANVWKHGATEGQGRQCLV